jgi:hypothetical protein
VWLVTSPRSGDSQLIYATRDGRHTWRRIDQAVLARQLQRQARG